MSRAATLARWPGFNSNGGLPDRQITRIARRTFSNSTIGTRGRLSAPCGEKEIRENP
jgi:hypothetical protein